MMRHTRAAFMLSMAVVLMAATTALGMTLSDLMNKREANVQALVNATERLFAARCTDANCVSTTSSTTTGCSFSSCGGNAMFQRAMKCYPNFGTDSSLCGTVCSGLLRSASNSAVTVAAGATNNAEASTFVCSSSSLTPVFEDLYENQNVTGWQYVASNTGVTRSYPAAYQSSSTSCAAPPDIRQANWYVSASTGPKDIVFVCDFSGSMAATDGGPNGMTRLTAMKIGVISLVGSLGPNDRFNIVCFSSGVTVLGPAGALLAGTPANILAMQNALNAFAIGGGTYYAGAFSAALSLMQSTTSTGCARIVMFLSDGAPSDAAATITAAIATGQAGLGANRARIFTYSLSYAFTPTFLQGVACKNGGMWNQIVDASSASSPMQQYYRFQAVGIVDGKPQWTAPYTSLHGQGSIVTVSIAYFDRSVTPKVFAGVAAIDVLVSELLSVGTLAQITAQTTARNSQCLTYDLTECQMQKLRNEANFVCPSPAPALTACTSTYVTVPVCTSGGTDVTTIGQVMCSTSATPTMTEMTCCPLNRCRERTPVGTMSLSPTTSFSREAASKSVTSSELATPTDNTLSPTASLSPPTVTKTALPTTSDTTSRTQSPSLASVSPGSTETKLLSATRRSMTVSKSATPSIPELSLSTTSSHTLHSTDSVSIRHLSVSATVSPSPPSASHSPTTSLVVTAATRIPSVTHTLSKTVSLQRRTDTASLTLPHTTSPRWSHSGTVHVTQTIADVSPSASHSMSHSQSASPSHSPSASSSLSVTPSTTKATPSFALSMTLTASDSLSETIPRESISSALSHSNSHSVHISASLIPTVTRASLTLEHTASAGASRTGTLSNSSNVSSQSPSIIQSWSYSSSDTDSRSVSNSPTASASITGRSASVALSLTLSSPKSPSKTVPRNSMSLSLSHSQTSSIRVSSSRMASMTRQTPSLERTASVSASGTGSISNSSNLNSQSPSSVQSRSYSFSATTSRTDSVSSAHSIGSMSPTPTTTSSRRVLSFTLSMSPVKASRSGTSSFSKTDAKSSSLSRHTPTFALSTSASAPPLSATATLSKRHLSLSLSIGRTLSHQATVSASSFLSSSATRSVLRPTLSISVGVTPSASPTRTWSQALSESNTKTELGPSPTASVTSDMTASLSETTSQTQTASTTSSTSLTVTATASPSATLKVSKTFSTSAEISYTSSNEASASKSRSQPTVSISSTTPKSKSSTRTISATDANSNTDSSSDSTSRSVESLSTDASSSPTNSESYSLTASHLRPSITTSADLTPSFPSMTFTVSAPSQTVRLTHTSSPVMSVSATSPFTMTRTNSRRPSQTHSEIVFSFTTTVSATIKRHSATASMPPTDSHRVTASSTQMATLSRRYVSVTRHTIRGTSTITLTLPASTSMSQRLQSRSVSAEFTAGTDTRTQMTGEGTMTQSKSMTLSGTQRTQRQSSSATSIRSISQLTSATPSLRISTSLTSAPTKTRSNSDTATGPQSESFTGRISSTMSIQISASAPTVINTRSSSAAETSTHSRSRYPLTQSLSSAVSASLLVSESSSRILTHTVTVAAASDTRSATTLSSSPTSSQFQSLTQSKRDHSVTVALTQRTATTTATLKGHNGDATRSGTHDVSTTPSSTHTESLYSPDVPPNIGALNPTFGSTITITQCFVGIIVILLILYGVLVLAVLLHRFVITRPEMTPQLDDELRVGFTHCVAAHHVYVSAFVMPCHARCLVAHALECATHVTSVACVYSALVFALRPTSLGEGVGVATLSAVAVTLFIRIRTGRLSWSKEAVVLVENEEVVAKKYDSVTSSSKTTPRVEEDDVVVFLEGFIDEWTAVEMGDDWKAPPVKPSGLEPTATCAGALSQHKHSSRLPPLPVPGAAYRLHASEDPHAVYSAVYDHHGYAEFFEDVDLQEEEEAAGYDHEADANFQNPFGHNACCKSSSNPWDVDVDVMDIRQEQLDDVHVTTSGVKDNNNSNVFSSQVHPPPPPPAPRRSFFLRNTAAAGPVNESFFDGDIDVSDVDDDVGNGGVDAMDASLSLSQATWVNDPQQLWMQESLFAANWAEECPSPQSTSARDEEEFSAHDGSASTLPVALEQLSEFGRGRQESLSHKASEVAPKKRSAARATRRSSAGGAVAVVIAEDPHNVPTTPRYALKDYRVHYAVHATLLISSFIGTVLLSAMVLPRDDQCEVFAVSFAIGVFVVDLVGVQGLYALLVAARISNPTSRARDEPDDLLWCRHPL